MGINGLIGSRHAAALLDMPRSTFNLHVHNGRIPYAYRLPGATGAFLFDPAVISRIAADRDRPRAQRGFTTGRRGADRPHDDAPATTTKGNYEN